MVNNLTSETITDATIECTAEGGWVSTQPSQSKVRLSARTTRSTRMPARARCTPPAWNRARQIVMKSQLHPAVSFSLFVSIGPLREGAEMPNI